MSAIPASLPASSGQPSQAGTVLFSALIFVLALLARLPHYNQSLWADEMSTYLDYVLAPWQIVVASQPGQYVPNNHVLFTVLVKILCTLSPSANPLHPSEPLLRLPSLLAGCILPIAVVWPLRKRAPAAAILLAILTCFHPWLIAFSDEARGYSLMILLGVLATNLLPKNENRWPISYAIALAAAIYTISVAALLLPAHAVFVIFFRRAALKSWARGMGMAVVLTTLLYLPMAKAISAYAHDPLPAPNSYFDFINQLPRFALAAGAPAGLIYWFAPVSLLIIGSALALVRRDMRPILIVMAAATIAGLFAPLLIRSSVQVRFVPWIAIWLCISLTAILLLVQKKAGNPAMIVLLIVTLSAMMYHSVEAPPNQPIREAIRAADNLAPPDCKLLIGFLTAKESASLYGREAISHQIMIGPSVPAFLAAERAGMQSTGHKPWIILSYESMVHDYSGDFWLYFNRNYRLVIRLPGMMSPVAIYRPTVLADTAL